MFSWHRKRFFVKDGQPSNNDYYLEGILFDGYKIHDRSGRLTFSYNGFSLAQRRLAQAKLRELRGFSPAQVIDRFSGNTVFAGSYDDCRLKAAALNRGETVPWEEIVQRMVAETLMHEPLDWEIRPAGNNKYHVVNSNGHAVATHLSRQAAEALMGVPRQLLGPPNPPTD